MTVNNHNYDSCAGLMTLITALSNGRDLGTGILPFANWGKNILGLELPRVLLEYNVGMQNNLYGDYPGYTEYNEKIPSAIFMVVFFVLMIAHLTIFFINYSRHHYFYLTLFWALYCCSRILGFGLRIVWSNDISRVNLGIGDEALLVLTSIALVASNLILAQRIFTWRHPVGGTRKLFTNIMLVLYAIVAVGIILTVAGSAIPYLYYLDSKSYMGYQICVMLVCILIILYCVAGTALIALAYFFKPTRKDENLYTYQPWWIESFHPLYFVKPGAKLEAEETFMKRNHNHRHAKRVIAATHHHYNMVEGLTNQRGDLKHNKSIIIISISTIFLLVEAVFRCIIVFQSHVAFEGGPLQNAATMYVTWGGLEAIINIMFIVGRVDLRFYKPDKLPKKVRNIITAEQSVLPSIEHSDEEMSDEMSDEEMSHDGMSAISSEMSSNTTDDISFADKKPPVNSPPHYSSGKDNDSEFHF